MRKTYEEHLELIKSNSYHDEEKFPGYIVYTDNCLPEVWENKEVDNGDFKTNGLGSYNYEDITTRMLAHDFLFNSGVSEKIVMPLNIVCPPMERIHDEPIRQPIKGFNDNDALVFGWWKYSQLVNLHPYFKRHPHANLIIHVFEENFYIVGLTYLRKDEDLMSSTGAELEGQELYKRKLDLYRDACYLYFDDLKKDFWKIEIRKSVFSKLNHTNISLPRYLFKDNKLLQDGVMFKIKNDNVMLWDENETINIYHVEKQIHLIFSIDDLPDIINDKEIKKLIKFNNKDIHADWVHAHRAGRNIQDEFMESNLALSKSLSQYDDTHALLSVSIKLLAAYCTPTLKKGIKKVSKKAPRNMNRRKRVTQPTKWIWGTNNVTYIYPPQKKKKKGVSEYYSRPTMAKYYITNLNKYNDRPIYEEEHENPRYRNSIIRSRAGCWKGGKDKLFFAGAESNNYSQRAITWLKQKAKETGMKIQHAENGKEFRIELGHNSYYLADGYCEETNTIFEFNGDYWHGNPSVYQPEEINKSTKTTFGELYQRTIEKERMLKQMGFNVVSVWEKDWMKSVDSI
jgi:hypothetical protein